jgi:hypothetical protein
MTEREPPLSEAQSEKEPLPLSEVQSEKQPLPLSEAQFNDLDQRLVGIKASLVDGFPRTSPEQHVHLSEQFEDIRRVFMLYELIISFRNALKKDGERDGFGVWLPQRLVRRVLQACRNQQYEDHDHEYIFYMNGGTNGLCVLYLGTRFQTSLFAKIDMLSPELKVELAKQCGRESIPSVVFKAWMEAYDRSPPEGIFSCTRDFQ